MRSLVCLLIVSSALNAAEIKFEAQELDAEIAKVACYAVTLGM